VSYTLGYLGKGPTDRSWWEDAACIALGPACWGPQAVDDYQGRQPPPDENGGGRGRRAIRGIGITLGVIGGAYALYMAWPWITGPIRRRRRGAR
jgi:hypothetical protein